MKIILIGVRPQTTTIEIYQLPQALNLRLFTSNTRMTLGLVSQKTNRDTILTTGLT